MLNRNQIIGQRLVCIHCIARIEDNWLDMSDCMFELESGLLFRLPGSAESLVEAELPPGAQKLVHASLRPVYGATVVELLRPAEDDDFCPGTARLGLSSGKWILHEIAAPHGTGGAGIQILDEVDRVGMVDFWRKG